MNKTFYITTPIYYPNARLHAGHAYTTLICDALARYKRQCGYDVAFLTGTDEHGEKLERAAAAAGMTPQAFVAEKREEIQELWKLLEIDYTHFIYTDRPDHTVSVQRMLKRAQKAGYVYKGHYQGRYCVHDERYISDGSEPVDCDVCGRAAELISEDNYFFKLSAFRGRLLKHFEDNPRFVQPDFRFNEVKSFVRRELRDISISRKRIKWGVPWPDDPDQVFYVWYDALTSYMTGIGYGAAEPEGTDEFRHYWPADIHMIGKDIIRFHAVYWPAFLMAAFPDQPGMLPKQIVAHGWLKVGEEKMSKSKGNAVYVEPVAKFFRTETNGVVSGSDVMRYYLLRDFIFGQDGTVSYERMLERYNSDLANDLGNLASRTITMLNRYLGGVVPEAPAGETPGSDYNLPIAANGVRNGFIIGWNRFEFSRALDEVWSFINIVNGFLNDHQPWAIAGDPSKREQLEGVLYSAAEALRFIAVLLYPVTPKAAECICKQLGCEGNLKDQNPDDLEWGGLEPGTRVGKPEIIFPRLDVDAAVEKLLSLDAASQPVVQGATEQPSEEKKRTTTMAQQPKPGAPAGDSRTPSAQPPAPSPDKISIEDFAKVEMRTGEVKAAERVPGASKLLKLLVDIGTEVRQVVAGIAEYYEPEKLIGMKVVLVTNLQPRKLRGVESNGMIVAASVEPEGRPVLVTFKEDVPNGTRLK
jgi:methionyl-tRNA synthetase